MLLGEDTSTLGSALASAGDALARFSVEEVLRRQYPVDATFLSEHQAHLYQSLSGTTKELARYCDWLQRGQGSASLLLKEGDLAVKVRSAADGIRLYCDMLETARRDVYGDIHRRCCSNTGDIPSGKKGCDIRSLTQNQPELALGRSHWLSVGPDFSGISREQLPFSTVGREQSEALVPSGSLINLGEGITGTRDFHQTLQRSCKGEVEAIHPRRAASGEATAAVDFQPLAGTAHGVSPSVVTRYAGKRGGSGMEPTIVGCSSLLADHNAGSYAATTPAGDAPSHGDRPFSTQFYLCRFCDSLEPFWDIDEVTKHEQLHLSGLIEKTESLQGSYIYTRVRYNDIFQASKD